MSWSGFFLIICQQLPAGAEFFDQAAGYKVRGSGERNSDDYSAR
jgi:hypothetical protein